MKALDQGVIPGSFVFRGGGARVPIKRAVYDGTTVIGYAYDYWPTLQEARDGMGLACQERIAYAADVARTCVHRTQKDTRRANGKRWYRMGQHARDGGV